MSNFFEFPLSGDILRGAPEISEFPFGDKNCKPKVYYLAERGSLPLFRMGSVLCVRKSTLIDWIVAMECSCSSKLGALGAQNVSEVL
jgi:hypothetical protein